MQLGISNATLAYVIFSVICSTLREVSSIFANSRCLFLAFGDSLSSFWEYSSPYSFPILCKGLGGAEGAQLHKPKSGPKPSYINALYDLYSGATYGLSAQERTKREIETKEYFLWHCHASGRGTCFVATRCVSQRLHNAAGMSYGAGNEFLSLISAPPQHMDGFCLLKMNLFGLWWAAVCTGAKMEGCRFLTGMAVGAKKASGKGNPIAWKAQWFVQRRAGNWDKKALLRSETLVCTVPHCSAVTLPFTLLLLSNTLLFHFLLSPIQCAGFSLPSQPCCFHFFCLKFLRGRFYFQQFD